MAVTLKAITDTVLKQKPIDSSQLAEQDKENLSKGQELELHSWAEFDDEDKHIRVAFSQVKFKEKNTWYAFEEHIQIWKDGQLMSLKPVEVVPTVSILLKNYTACSTAGLKGLDRQLIAEINEIVPNALVSFEDLNVRLGAAVWPFVQPSAKAALNRAIQSRGIPLSINSAYRTIAQQQVLYNHYRSRRCGIPVAAPPPTSNHQSGVAIDVNDPWSWKPYLQRYGWRHLGPGDPPHFDYVGGGTRDLRNVAVLAFQRLWNRYNVGDRIPEDSSFGPATMQRLNNSPVEGFSMSLPARPSPSTASTPKTYRVLRLTNPFMQGSDVRQVQEALRKWGAKVTVDGVFGSASQTAVKDFQRKNGLVADGIVGEATRSKLGL